MKKILTWSIAIIVIVLAFLIYWNYYNTYSEGNRSGILQKFSKKGNIFKTYEGELIMSSIASTGNAVIASEKFFFSVTSDSLAQVLFKMEGQRLTLHYEQKRKNLPWNGESEYIVSGIVETEKEGQ